MFHVLPPKQNLLPFRPTIMKLLSLLTPAALAYSLCDPANYPYKGQNVSIELVQSSTKVLILNDLTSSIPFLSGTIQIVDGCTFQVRNLDLNASAVWNFEWYGAFKNGGDAAISLSATPLQISTRNSSIQTFAFKTIAGAAVSFKDFNQFRLYETKSKSVVATADLPPNAQVVAPGTSTPTGSNPSTTSPQGGNNGVLNLSPSSSLLLAFVILIVS